jgi:hypothetical protein
MLAGSMQTCTFVSSWLFAQINPLGHGVSSPWQATRWLPFAMHELAQTNA